MQWCIGGVFAHLIEAAESLSLLLSERHIAEAMCSAVIGAPEPMKLSTKSCSRPAACRACCSIRGASVSAKQQMSVSTLHYSKSLLGQEVS